jgi:SAM-dependent methyltransferase
MQPVTDTEAVRRLFDELAGEYDQHLPFFATFGRDLAAWIGLRPGQRVLDIAAGRGAVAGPAAQAVGADGAVLAVDNAPNMLRALAGDYRGVRQLATSVMDARRLGVKDACFDAVTCGFAFAGDAEKPDIFTPPPRPLTELCAEACFTGIEQHRARATFALRDPQHYCPLGPRRRSAEGLSGQPGAAERVQGVRLRAGQLGHVELDGKAEAQLQVSQVPVTFRERG